MNMQPNPSPKASAPIVTELEPLVVGNMAMRMQQVVGVSLLTGLPVVTIGPVFLPAKATENAV